MGFGSGLLVSIASGTASAFILPILTVIAGVSIYRAIGTSLFIDAIIGLIAGIIFLKKGKVEIKPIIFLGLTGVISAFIGSRFTSSTPEAWLTIVIGMILFVMGLNFLKNGIRKNIDYFENKINFDIFRNNKIIFYLLIGIPIGFMSGFMGMGSSGIVAVFLVLFFGLDLHTGIGTSLLMMMFIAFSGGLGHAIQGEIVYQPIYITGFGAVIGAIGGSIFANRINEEKMGKVIGVIISIMGTVFILKSFY